MPKGYPFNPTAWANKKNKKAASKADRTARPNKKVSNQDLDAFLGEADPT